MYVCCAGVSSGSVGLAEGDGGDGAELAEQRWRLWGQRRGEPGQAVPFPRSGKPKTHLVRGLGMFPSPAASPGAGAGFGNLLPGPVPAPGSSRGGSSAGSSALPGPVVSREMLTPLTRCQNTNTQPDSLKSNYEGAAEPGLAFDSEESCKRHQHRNPAQHGPGTFLAGNKPVCLLKWLLWSFG